MSASRKMTSSLLLALILASSAFAGSRPHSSSSSASSPGSVHVSGYYRQNGTYVAPYNRRAPGTATGATTQTSGANGMTSAEGVAAENPSPETLLPKNETKNEPLPKGFSTAEERSKKAKREEQRQLVEYNRNQVRIAALDTSGNPIIARGGISCDTHGKIKRSESAKHNFMRMTGYPSGRPGYVVDHIIPLAKGGADDPSNMQWQTVEEAKAKDKWERK